MGTLRHALAIAAAILVSVIALTGQGRADSYPSRPIQVIVSYPAGGAQDMATRIIAPRMAEILGQPLVIVPKPGAAGSLGVDFVLNSPADGYTIVSSSTATLTLNPLYMDSLKYTYRDVAPIGTFAVEVNAIVVRADAKWKTFEELLDDAAKNPGKLTFGSPGVGSVSTTMMEAIKAERGLNMTSIPFVGSPPVNVAVLGGQVDFGTAALSTAAPMVQSGQLRLLAVGGTQRVQMFPEVKTFREFGFKLADLQLKIGLFANSKTPRDIVEKLSAAFDKAVDDPQVAAELTKIGLVPRVENAKAAEAGLLREDQDVHALGKLLGLHQ